MVVRFKNVSNEVGNYLITDGYLHEFFITTYCSACIVMFYCYSVKNNLEEKIFSNKMIINAVPSPSIRCIHSRSVAAIRLQIASIW